MKAKFNRNNYIHIPGWAITDLNLNGNDLLTYSIIYGFSQDNTSYFTGSISYLESALNVSRNTIIKALKKLTENNIIIREEVPVNGILFVKYKYNSSIIEPLVQNEKNNSSVSDIGSSVSDIGSSVSDIGSSVSDICSSVSDIGSSVSAPNNTNNNTNKEKEYIYKDFNFKKSLIDYGFREDLVNDWLLVRKKKGGVNTEVSFNKFIKQVELNGSDKNLILEECVYKSWAGFESSWFNKQNTQQQVQQNINPQTGQPLKFGEYITESGEVKYKPPFAL